MKALVINGPNLNMLGIREPDIYGTDTYEELVQVCRDAAESLGLEDMEVFQSNHEGAIVDRIQEAYGNVDGIVINPAAYTHTSIAILDALKAVGIPAVEVHISAIVDRIQEAYGNVDGIVINPAAYTHTSIAILDALKAVGIPAVEVHISPVGEREEFRRISYAGMACFTHVSGEGIRGYAHALEMLANHLSA